MVRSYIFTENEVRRLKRWLETGEEDDTTRQIFVQIRRNMNTLTKHVHLLTLVARELRVQGRIAGRARLPRDLGSTLQLLESGLTMRTRERSTPTASSGGSGNSTGTSPTQRATRKSS